MFRPGRRTIRTIALQCVEKAALVHSMGLCRRLRTLPHSIRVLFAEAGVGQGVDGSLSGAHWLYRLLLCLWGR